VLDIQYEMGGNGEDVEYWPFPIETSTTKRVRYLFVKPHTNDNGTLDDRTLFATGLPAGLDEKAFLQLFSQHGDIEQAAIHGSRLSGLIKFSKKKGLKSVLKACSKGQVTQIDLATPFTQRGHFWGLRAWVESHKAQKPGNDVLQTELDRWMGEYEAEQEEKKRKALEASLEDGWTVVQRHKGRRKSSSDGGNAGPTVVGAVAAAAASSIANRKMMKTEYSDFYRFQQREKRRNELLELREKFEQDKRRLAELKSMRNFKPFDA
jgi:hypothetical protein